ncbi:MAG: hypothetical protein HY047_14820 [Acidobacteria bacterium]|nr:hypothetical protein [Acidobacteriota bacterium]
MAHEIAHTFFFDTAHPRPRPYKETPPYPVLESLCQTTASEIVLPEPLIKKFVSRLEPLSIEQVLALSDAFDVSADVVLHRISRSPQLVASSHAVLLLERRGGDDAVIVASFFGSALLAYFPRPEKRKLSDWNPGLIPSRTEGLSDQWSEILPLVCARRLQHPTASSRFFLELVGKRDL